MKDKQTGKKINCQRKKALKISIAIDKYFVISFQVQRKEQAVGITPVESYWYGAGNASGEY